ncbi:MAG: deoxyuridine 5'-triphosphate nucleotidohydrolase [Candidatus Anstonellales archaeon]
MILTEKEIRSKRIISGHIGDEQFQPAGVDLTLKEVYSYDTPGKIDYDNSERKISDCIPLNFSETGELYLKKGAYKIVVNEVVSIPTDCAAMALPRSSLVRSGATISSALWDPGYKGRSEMMLIVHNDKGITLKRSARVAQIVFIKLSSEAKAYEGKYQNENIDEEIEFER